MHSERVIWVIPILISSDTGLNHPSWHSGSDWLHHAIQGKCLFLLQTEFTHASACQTVYSSPLLPITHSTWAKKRISSVLSYYVWWGQCASSCCLNPRCQEGRQGSLRAELWWDYKPFDLACFSVVPCFLSHSIILYCYLSSTGCTEYKGLSLFLYK